MTNNKQQTEINAVEYLDKVNQFAKENNTDKPRQQTAIEWLFDNVYMAHSELSEKLQQAKEMDKERIIQAYSHGWHDGQDTIIMTIEHIDKGGDERGLKYYEQLQQTYGGGEQ
jgi:nitrate reductase assembly molybdenum cofactor insertion protein NarJ